MRLTKGILASALALVIISPAQVQANAICTGSWTFVSYGTTYVPDSTPQHLADGEHANCFVSNEVLITARSDCNANGCRNLSGTAARLVPNGCSCDHTTKITTSWGGTLVIIVGKGSIIAA